MRLVNMNTSATVAISIITEQINRAKHDGINIRAQIYAHGMFNMYLHADELVDDLSNGVYGNNLYITVDHDSDILIKMDELA